MGSRADFYIGEPPDVEWLGSIAWDGYPEGIPDAVLSATGEAGYRAAVAKMIAGREDGTTPADGWPWPWEDSGTTDYAYVFHGGVVLASQFGGALRGPGTFGSMTDEEAEAYDAMPAAAWPDMTSIQNTTLGKRSGVMIFSAPKR